MRLWPANRLSTLAGLVLLGLNVPELRAQPKPPARPEFEVASIKLVPPSPNSLRVSLSGEHGRINYTNATLRSLIRKAYGLRVYPLSTGISDPLSSDKYDIVAKGPSNASEEQTMLMLQTLLVGRFNLVIHREMRELPVYALALGKNKPKLHEVQDDGSAPEIGSSGGHQITAHHISMNLLAVRLAAYVGYEVKDTTGLTGLFDLTLDFSIDENLSANRESGLTLFEAVQRQLGLKLEARKGPVEVVVIDHVDKPSGN